jgi:drug/metabolite transporter (DMT)-like permease
MSIFFFLPIGLTVISNVIYHIILKVTSNTINPLLGLTATYLASAATCLVLLPIFPVPPDITKAIKSIPWPFLILGIVIAFLELGFSLAYKVGWNISLAGIVSSTCVGLLLIPVGIFLFREHPTGVNLLGILLCIFGLILVNLKN